MFLLLVFLSSTVGCVCGDFPTVLHVQLYSCSGNPATVICEAEQVQQLEWEISTGPMLTYRGSSTQPRDGNTTIAGIQITSSSSPNADDPQLLDIQSTLTFTQAEVPQDAQFKCSAMNGGSSVSSQIIQSQFNYEPLHMNHTVVEYKQDVVVIAVTWEPYMDDSVYHHDSVYHVRAIPENAGDTITQESSSPPVNLNLRYNTNYDLTVEDTKCSKSTSTRFSQSGCSMPVPPENGQLNGFVSSHVGAEITYQCPSGTSVNVTCSDDLLWAPAPSEVSCIESNSGNCGTVNGDNLRVQNNTGPNNVLLTCVEGFEPEEAVQVQCVNGTWHPDPATIHCTEKSPPTNESGNENGNVNMLIIITVASILLASFILLSIIVLLACLRILVTKRKHHKNEEGLGKVGSGPETNSSTSQLPQNPHTIGGDQLQQSEVSCIPGRQHMALMMTMNVAYDVVHNGDSTAEYTEIVPRSYEEKEEYHYYY